MAYLEALRAAFLESRWPAGLLEGAVFASLLSCTAVGASLTACLALMRGALPSAAALGAGADFWAAVRWDGAALPAAEPAWHAWPGGVAAAAAVERVLPAGGVASSAAFLPGSAACASPAAPALGNSAHTPETGSQWLGLSSSMLQTFHEHLLPLRHAFRHGKQARLAYALPQHVSLVTGFSRPAGE